MTVEGVEGAEWPCRLVDPGRRRRPRARSLSVWSVFPILLGGGTASHAFWLQIEPIDVAQHDVFWHVLVHRSQLSRFDPDRVATSWRCSPTCTSRTWRRAPRRASRPRQRPHRSCPAHAARVGRRRLPALGGRPPRLTVRRKGGDRETGDLRRIDVAPLVPKLQGGVDESGDGRHCQRGVDGPELAALDPFGHQAGDGSPPVRGPLGDQRVAVGVVLGEADDEPQVVGPGRQPFDVLGDERRQTVGARPGAPGGRGGEGGGLVDDVGEQRLHDRRQVLEVVVDRRRGDADGAGDVGDAGAGDARVENSRAASRRISSRGSRSLSSAIRRGRPRRTVVVTATASGDTVRLVDDGEHLGQSPHLEVGRRRRVEAGGQRRLRAGLADEHRAHPDCVRAGDVVLERVADEQRLGRSCPGLAKREVVDPSIGLARLGALGAGPVVQQRVEAVRYSSAPR